MRSVRKSVIRASASWKMPLRCPAWPFRENPPPLKWISQIFTTWPASASCHRLASMLPNEMDWNGQNRPAMDLYKSLLRSWGKTNRTWNDSKTNLHRFFLKDTKVASRKQIDQVLNFNVSHFWLLCPRDAEMQKASAMTGTCISIISTNNLEASKPLSRIDMYTEYRSGHIFLWFSIWYHDSCIAFFTSFVCVSNLKLSKPLLGSENGHGSICWACPHLKQLVDIGTLECTWSLTQISEVHCSIWNAKRWCLALVQHSQAWGPLCEKENLRTWEFKSSNEILEEYNGFASADVWNNCRVSEIIRRIFASTTLLKLWPWNQCNVLGFLLLSRFWPWNNHGMVWVYENNHVNQ